MTITVYSQTKRETQDWISQKIPIYSYSSSDIQRSYNVTFEGDYIVITGNIVDKMTAPLVLTYVIPIKEINSVSFSEKPNNIWMSIRIKGNKNLIKTNAMSGDWSGNEEYKSEVNLVLDKTIAEDNMKSRIIKAFNRLITLYGGTVAKEVF